MREEKKGRNSFVGARTNAPRCSVYVYAGVGGNSEFVFRRLHLSWPVIHANDLRAGPPALLGTESARAGGGESPAQKRHRRGYFALSRA